MKYLPIILLMLLTACQPTSPTTSPNDYKQIDVITWQGKHAYPFVEPSGEISCVLGAVYFTPNSKLGNDEAFYPLNEAAIKTVSNHDMKGILKPGADLTEAVNYGLEICRKANQNINR